MFEVFPRYLPSYCPLLCLSTFDRHEGGYGLANKGANCVGSNCIVTQKIFIVEVSCIVLRCSATIVRRWRTIVRCSEKMVRRSNAIVLHFKLYTIALDIVTCKYCSKQ